MNEFAGFATPRGTGWWAMLRFARDAKPKPVLGEGGAPIVFDTELEALRTVNRHLVGYMNGPEYRRDGAVIEAQSAADAVFNGLKPFIRQRGSNRRTEVERVSREARG
ncbi:hypothetical protein J2X76_003658 [Neorhizobium sp. 2083]|uniref:hypothetical protein n=1 Tax=Neorhizobium sp. 2083 TaxID=2817762 RepID=UPI002859025F|nr:hypothetical protein [Neorhizobium sp. 2083]MDR6818481.1 hypothetical protein [Neorhizobium sp. 2083]